MANAQLSAQEQLLLELMNRARLDPAGEAARYGTGLNSGLSSGRLSAAPKAPLAPNHDLSEAAARHSDWLLDRDAFSHTGQGGSTPTARMSAAGYDFTGAWTSGENISLRGILGGLNPTAMAQEHHKALFLSPGHRVNILGQFREAGVGQETGTYGGYDASMLTEAFARSGSKAFVTGVAFQDRDGDRFYDAGEGRGGIRIDWLGNDGGAASTQSAGGYKVAVPAGLSGRATVAVTVDGTTLKASLDMTGGNVKLDVVNGRVLAASTDMALGQNAKHGRLLGVAGLDLKGNGHDNRLEGNKGANGLIGGGGDDRLLGGGGPDRLIGGTGGDILVGGRGGDDFVFQSRRDSRPGGDRDLIRDFDPGSDDIDLRAIDARAGTGRDDDFGWSGRSAAKHSVWWSTDDGDVILKADVTGDRRADIAVRIEDLGRIGAGDVLL